MEEIIIKKKKLFKIIDAILQEYNKIYVVKL